MCRYQNQREQVKIKIELLEQQKSRAAQVRSRVKGVEEGGKKQEVFFFLLEKKIGLIQR